MNHYEWPSPDATRAEVDLFVAQHAEVKFAVIDCNGCGNPVGYVLGVDSVPLDEDETLCRTCFGKYRDERSKAVANGPTVVCCACGVAIPAMGTPLCAVCLGVPSASTPGGRKTVSV